MASPKRRPEPSALGRELYLFALYRLLEASLLALMVFSPAGAFIGEPRDALLAESVAFAYAPMALVLVLYARHSAASPRSQALIGAVLDITVAALITHALPGAGPGVAMMLMFNVGAAALLVRIELGLAVAAAAVLALIGEYVWNSLSADAYDRPLAEVLMFSVSFFAIATFSNLLGRQIRESQELAEQRSAEAANLTEVNGLIIRRMRTGVLVVDGGGFVRLANEAALLLLGESREVLAMQGPAAQKPRNLRMMAPELADRLQAWQARGETDDTPLQIGDERIEVLPRFARLLAKGETTLVFLDDASMVSRRAESLTLAAMGRFSASLAHEIRNPLAAISYATQLLQESNDISTPDRRLLDIVHQQCMRTNAIVESVLGLARRERAHAEHLDLVDFVRRFLDEFRQSMPPDVDSLSMSSAAGSQPALVDPRHLQQILTVLVQNALRYGRMPGAPARVILRVEARGNMPVLEVLDRGPGIPDAVVAQLFRPFFTTSEHGTGLGLYIARELCHANGASLDYVAVPAGGACFRITLPGPDSVLPL
ncbi:sensor histidine kinase [Luteimonas panaciterrae]|uniref:sensor histidine kinase n=1 Tax=Luteimonas panaciterrae TaxID=363885 RepID=UPI001CFA38F3|nr:HAMP domain-containing sensor histidine kinase [Luteimonas panaciterrae]